jgi:3-hydroxybutyryl-CoA dehydrogenase
MPSQELNHEIKQGIMTEKISIGVVGLGLMGSSIATCILAAGHPVTGMIKNMDKLTEVKERIHSFLQQLSEEGILKEDVSKVMQRLSISNDYKLLRDHEVVVESIIENLEEKKRVFAQLEEVLSSTAVIGSNTSAIPVTILQDGMKHADRLLGIHWAEPAHITRFLEIICGKNSDLTYAEKISALALGWGKEPSIVKKDIRGFITNRLMYALMREAFFLVEKGYAEIEDIDRACR